MKIKKFLEYSKYHDEDIINSILDKISEKGIGSLDNSEKAILDNYSKEDADIDKLMYDCKKLKEKIKDIDEKIELSFKQDNWTITSNLQEMWFKVNNELMEKVLKLKYLYKIDTKVLEYED